ncbi:hypothetical protein [Paenibacillus radicis (ex Xue et al. 2023)]|uniref:Uncharacterized protein n=1 Tax=Paenibacillus radicis (ex Xue et al. 2023) TaxID=2972489 RepID=A0ABT1YCZ8_9BACL|nr:hypothetical protein [Paenibacillus radicis (ex Xue et al. 2023)]MCR8631041.1 hypothetical protein [Paenibacillus radicis (ex Xue et al. 2023)]
MSIPLLIKFFFSTIELIAVTTFALSIFRFPLRYHFSKILAISIAMSITAFYLREIAMLKNYAVLSMLSTEMIMITLLFSLPLYYSLVITIIGFMLAGIIEYAVMMAATWLNLTNAAIARTNFIHSSSVFLITAIIVTLMTIYIRYRKFGFMFMANKLTMNQAIKKYNFALSAVIVVFILIIQLTSLSYNNFSIHSFILIILSIFCVIGISIAYKHNKKLINDKHERLKKR